MKKNKYSISVICLLFIFLLLPLGCESPGDEFEVSFNAEVINKDQNSLLVEPEEGSAELSSADRIMVYISDAKILNVGNEEVGIDAIREGMQIQIFYDGQVAESYPAQIHNCSRIIVLDNENL